MEIKKIAVLGIGTMGSGITQVSAMSGFDVYVRDVKEDFIERGMGIIKSSLEKLASKGKLSESVDTILGRIKTTTSLEEAVKEADIVIEAVPEVKDLKKETFEAIDKLAPKDAILASNTSSISITELGAYTSRPEKVIGMHFFNPVPIMKLVEVIKGLVTSEETHSVVMDLAKKMGKDPVTVEDFPGFVANRILLPFLNEACFALMEGVASVEDIDKVAKLGFNHPMGPFTLADFIGLDVCLYILNVMYEEYKDPKFKPCPLLVKLVKAGHLGRKTGKGFYNYEK